MDVFKEAMYLYDKMSVCVQMSNFSRAGYYSKKIDEFKKVHPIAEWFAKVLH